MSSYLKDNLLMGLQTTVEEKRKARILIPGF
jgi:hypothetical protein